MIYQFTPERFLITVMQNTTVMQNLTVILHLSDMQNIIVMLNEVKHLYRFFVDAQNDRKTIGMAVVRDDRGIIRMPGDVNVYLVTSDYFGSVV